MTLSLIKEFDFGLKSDKAIKGLTSKTLHAQNPSNTEKEALPHN